MSNSNPYSAYFDIDENYFPQVNEFTIRSAGPDFWTFTYPHSTFIEMLSSMERILARQEMRTLWVEGAYGTGKSQCIYALKKILEVPEEELRAYWNKYEALKQKPDLLEKLIGHRQSGVLTAYRYASGSINSPRDLFLAIQNTLKDALEKAGLYTGENTLKDSVIAWIEQSAANKTYLDSLLQEPEWAALFPQSSADEILTALRSRDGEIKSLMDNLFRLADKVGITALNIDADRLIAWISDIIDQNNIKVVFLWDEFSDYFKNNRESLSDFQKLVELVSAKPFYLVVVTHESGQLFTTADTTWTKVRDRFHPVKISLPDNIAFELIGHALKIKEPAQDEWTRISGNLNSRVDTVRSKVMEAAGIKDPEVMRKILPLHPVAALLLKNIATAFQSNQRSMFDFIKSSGNDNVQAFQWFIAHNSPASAHPFLTVDLLWNFFYDRGKDNLSSDIRLILDTFPQQQDLREDEKTVLKAILIMQAIDLRLGGIIDLFKATDQYLSYVFQGIPDLEGSRAGHLARGLKEKGILVSRPISGNRQAYAAAVLAGDQIKIDKYKQDVRLSSSTAKLVTEGGLASVLALPPALRLRFETEAGSGKITAVTDSDFTKNINILRDKAADWRFQAVLAFARDNNEAAGLREKIREAVRKEEYRNIVFIDALSTPIGEEALEQYVEYSAMSMYYQGSNNQASAENSAKAKQVLEQDWKNRIYNGSFIVSSFDNQEGEKVGNAQGVASILQVIVRKRFPLVFDFARGLTEAQFKPSSLKQSAKAGIVQKSSGVVVGLEKHLLPTVWTLAEPDYWTNPSPASADIAKIKSALDAHIQKAFQEEGQITTSAIYDLLEGQFGFAPCNLSAFLAGFLLKEYSSDPYRYSDSSGAHEPMTPDKLAEMLGDYINPAKRARLKTTALVRMTPDEMAFYELTEKVWDIPAQNCTSADQAARAIGKKMKEWGLPIWCLEGIDEGGCFDIVQRYIELGRSSGQEAHRRAVELGRIAVIKPNLATCLRELLGKEQCQRGMRDFLRHFEGGRILQLAAEIGAESSVLNDIRSLFDVEHANLWDREIGENEIRKLLTDYGFAKTSQDLLNASASSREAACKAWQERLNLFRISCDALKQRQPELGKVLDGLLKVYRRENLLPEQWQYLHQDLVTQGAALKAILDGESTLFAKLYAPYLEELGAEEIEAVKNDLPHGLFALSATDCNACVKSKAEEFKKNQLKSKLFRLWRDKTNTRTPEEWSQRYRTPILCCVADEEYEQAQTTFEILNKNWGAAETDIQAGLRFLEQTKLFEVIQDETRRDALFSDAVLQDYALLLTDLNTVRDRLETVVDVSVYDWDRNPHIRKKVQQLAEAEYQAGGSDRVLRKIEEMGDAQLKRYLKALVSGNIQVGLAILAEQTGGEQDDA